MAIDMKTFIRSVMGGVAISIGGMIYIRAENHVVGAFLFSIGLFTIYTFGLDLYTGKVCLIPNKPLKFLGTVFLVYLGNAVGTAASGYLLRATKESQYIEHAAEVVGLKLADNLFSTFIMAVMCGLLMCIAVLGFMNIKDGIGRYLALILPVMVFILSGYEHSIADMFYFSFANAWGGKAFVYINVIAIGNLIGGCILPLAAKITGEASNASGAH
ncbi:formate/nitrite transporter family protein [Anaerocolumna xylanovorans]|uniref:Formate/nitrite transporter FocA, FNT family n=1 Tax=Anaerocolumna xylanovorans DSM 12503 TaxID=1121345 RepID=A0A1M7YA54_9FIRM|nr:formate/nitrite transporter family protein [Anaerocolumna xylanovorans]SHO49514.1 Formate/nitrite transporter FocA, FNT family [Anaerocolumna xylanovorans DSM 12503]